jgi:superfamily II DNA helicase RecQ
VRHVLAGRNTLVVMPTGSGKSLIYQLVALLLPGTTLVISTLVAFMKDQIDGLVRCIDWKATDSDRFAHDIIHYRPSDIAPPPPL